MSDLPQGFPNTPRLTVVFCVVVMVVILESVHGFFVIVCPDAGGPTKTWLPVNPFGPAIVVESRPNNCLNCFIACSFVFSEPRPNEDSMPFTVGIIVVWPFTMTCAVRLPISGR